MRKVRQANPLLYCYRTLRANAKHRNVPFSLTLEQFKEFCARTEYLHKKGRGKEAYTIDRIRNWEGYHVDNIQVLPNKENSSKKHLCYDPDTGSYSYRTVSVVIPEEAKYF